MTKKLTCQWCGESPPKGKVKWWDGKPECGGVFACQKRAMARHPSHQAKSN